MTSPANEPVRKSITVAAPPEHAFRIFTEGMAQWWSPDMRIGAEPFETVVLEPGEGGRWFERGASGAECTWGRVLVWEPPHRLVVAWQITSSWRYDETFHTEVEVRFVSEAPSSTRVELEHRGLDAYGDDAAATRAALDSPGGWGGLLARFGGSVQVP